MAVLRRAGVLLLVALIVLGLGGAVAGAKKKHKKQPKWPSEVTLTHPSSTEFDGVVSSKFDPCRDSRLVTLYYTDGVTGLTQPLAVQRTDGKGRYQMLLPSPAYGGSYLAQVAEQKVRHKKVTNICKFASSSSIAAQGPPLSP
jgi:hypothetical protein